MSAERKKVLEMLAGGKITAEEAERLLEKLEPGAGGGGGAGRHRRRHERRGLGWGRRHGRRDGDDGPDAEPAGEATAADGPGKLRYLRVLVNSVDGDEVNIRVPLKLIRTGIKLGTVLPSDTSAKLAEKGIDLAELGSLEGEELVEALRELSVDVDAGNGDTVRIFCE